MNTKQPKRKSKPLIGITCSRCAGGRWSGYSLGHLQDFVYDAYSQGVLACGAAPLLIPVAQNRNTLAAICDALDGMILSGGPDINPRFYGEEPLPGLREVDEASDRMALELIAMALQRDIPVLGICRGIQVLNVYLGGTLYQDVPRQVPEAINHDQLADRATATHTVAIQSGTRLHGILRRNKLLVNSKHHQAVKDLAPGLIACAHSPDGIIEAVESTGSRFVLAVQWHPEGLWPHDACSRALLKAFIDAAA